METTRVMDARGKYKRSGLPSARRMWKGIKRHWRLYLLIIAPMAYIVIFKYIPMYGAQIAFRDYSVIKGFTGSEFVGLKHFQSFFQSPNFWSLIKNTLGISLYSLAIGFPAPIILALALNEIKSMKFKKTVQTVTFAPFSSRPSLWSP